MSTSKVLLFFVMLTYFIGLIVGIWFIYQTIMNTPEYTIQALTALFTYIGAPVAVTIGFYSWKAKAENMIKLPEYKLQEALEKQRKLEEFASQIENL